MAKSSIDANVNTSIFRKDWRQVIAKRRELASISPVRLLLLAGDYLAGQCIARDTSTGLFKKWSAASGGSYDTPCVVYADVLQADQPATGGALGQAIMGGFVYKDALLEYDSTFKTQVGGVEQTDARNVAILKF